MQKLSYEERQNDRREWYRYDIEGFCRYYLPDTFTAPFCDVHRHLLTLRGDQVSEVFRGVGKTSVTKAVVLHAILYGWRSFVLWGSWTVTQAAEHVQAIRDELEYNERILEDFGPQRGSVWKADDFTTRHGRTVKAVGVKTGVRGALRGSKRPDLLVVDDIENDERVQTVEQRDKLYKRLTTAFLNLGGAVGPELWAWVNGTPMHRDCVLRRLKADGWDYYRACATADGTPSGAPTWPEFDRDKIAARIRKIGSKAARQELFLDPLDEGEAAFERDWFRHYADDNHANWDHYVYVDPAIGLKNSSDYFVATVVAASPWGDEPEIRVVDQVVGKFSVGQQVRKIYALFEQYQPLQIGIEANAYQDALRQQVTEYAAKQGYRAPVVPVYSSRAKELRIRDASPAVEFGEVQFAVDHEDLIQHLCDWPSVAHDDIADSFAGAVKMVRKTGRLAV